MSLQSYPISFHYWNTFSARKKGPGQRLTNLGHPISLVFGTNLSPMEAGLPYANSFVFSVQSPYVWSQEPFSYLEIVSFILYWGFLSFSLYVCMGMLWVILSKTQGLTPDLLRDHS